MNIDILFDEWHMGLVVFASLLVVTQIIEVETAEWKTEHKSLYLLILGLCEFASSLLLFIIVLLLNAPKQTLIADKKTLNFWLILIGGVNLWWILCACFDTILSLKLLILIGRGKKKVK